MGSVWAVDAAQTAYTLHPLELN